MGARIMAVGSRGVGWRSPVQEVAWAMDIALDRSHEGKARLESLRGGSRLLGAGRPSSLDEAALLMCALSFGPLGNTDLARALKEVGMTMPDGSAITVQRAGECLQRLAKKGHGNPWGLTRGCPPETRIACLDTADTIEEKIVQLHHAKRDLADSLLAGTDTAHTLTADELIGLLRNQ
jgi:hypothetical protein